MKRFLLFWVLALGAITNLFAHLSIPNNEIHYTSTNGKEIMPILVDSFGGEIISNSYKNGEGVIVFDKSVTTIGKQAFARCSNLASIIIPESVTHIGDDAFSECNHLKYILFDGDTPKILDGDCFYNDQLILYVKNISEWNTTQKYGSKSILYKSLYGYCSEIVGRHDYDAIGICEICGLCISPVNVIRYTSTSGKVVLRNQNDFGAKIVLHEYSNGIGVITFDGPVTTIGNSAFYNASLSSVTIPNSVVNIGQYAFSGCSRLTSVDMPNSVVSIGEYAFAGCSKLRSFIFSGEIPVSIGANCFSRDQLTLYVKDLSQWDVWQHYGATTITYKTWQDIGKELYDGICSICGQQIPNDEIHYTTSDGNNLFPNPIYFGTDTYENGHGILKFGEHSSFVNQARFFSRFENLTSVYLHNGIETIYSWNFADCPALLSVAIPNSVVEIQKGAFQYCPLLENVNISPSVKTIGNSAFHGLPSMTRIVIPDGVIQIGDYAFAENPSLTKFNIPQSVNKIGINPLLGCTALASITVDERNKTYDSRDNCNAIIETSPKRLVSGCVNTNIPNSVVRIGVQAFDDCTGLTSITIPNSVQYLDSKSFEGCIGLTNITLSNSVVSIGYEAFHHCSALTSVEIPNSVKNIGEDAFTGCSSLTQVSVESGNAQYDSREDCNAIIETASNTLIVGCRNTTIPNGITSIKSLAFSNCIGLTGVIIPNSVTSIGSFAFGDCPDLKYILLLCSKPENMIDNCFGNDQLTLYVKNLYEWDITQMYQAKNLNYKPLKDYCEEIIGHHDGDEVCACRLCGLKSVHLFAEDDVNRDYCSRCNHGFFRYHTQNDKVYYFSELYFGDAKIVSNTYTPGGGVIEFDRRITSIGDYAFYNNTFLCGELHVPNSVTRIGKSAFWGCSNLTGSLVIPNSVTDIGEYAFCRCTGFNGSLTIPNSVTSVGNNAFYGCEGFDGALSVGKAVSYIGDNSFAGCSGFTGSLLLPSKLEKIGSFAFSECTGISAIQMQSLPNIGAFAFDQCTSNVKLVLTDDSFVTTNGFYYPSFLSASYNRQMSNEWGTLVLPFTIKYNPNNGVYRFYKMEKIEDDKMYFIEYAAGDINNGTPVVVRIHGLKDIDDKYTLFIEQAAPKNVDTSISNTFSSNPIWTMSGTFQPMTAAMGNQFDPMGKFIYYVAQNKFWFANQSFDLAPFRGWFVAPNILASSSLRICITEEATGIHSVEEMTDTLNSFDLQGRRMDVSSKGFQINAGKKIFVK